jgi:hypothetical protein
MASSFRDNLPQSPTSRLRAPAIPKEGLDKFPKSYQLFPSPDPKNPFGNLPKIQPPQPPFRIWEDPPIPAVPDILPKWPVPPSPSPGTPDPFPDPSKMRLPPIPLPQQPPYDLHPSNFPGQGGNEPPGGLLGMLQAMGGIQPGINFASIPNEAPEFNTDSYGSPQGLLGRLLALQNERARNAVDLYRNDGAGTRIAQTYKTPSQALPTIP